MANLTQALAAFDDLMAALRAAEGTGVWRGAYRADGWVWVWGSRAQLRHLLAHAQGQHVAEPPNNPYPDYQFMCACRARRAAASRLSSQGLTG